MSARLPPDYDRCQAETRPGSFMTLGPRQWVRCPNPPTVISTELVPDPKDGQRGSMSLCDECLAVFKKRFPQWRTQYQIVNIATGVVESDI